MVKLMPEFEKRNIKPVAMSLDTTENHLKWIKDINAFGGYDPEAPLPFPIIADSDRTIAVLLGMVKPAAIKKTGLPITARHLFVVGPDKKLKLSFIYPTTTGRNFSEVLRAMDSLQITDKYGVSTEANWQPGDRIVVPKGFPPEKADKLFVNKVEIEPLPSGKPYLQFAELKK
ncbi:peroxiredoxin-6-like [Spea bombifrons]|uniref:peroxiredoxin-6-like n=1 Tax=Spea bombifrons TaxID=233779 RepID=UPI002349710F|nr:peroxiredoxin-6-like [Spea bombifrons]